MRTDILNKGLSKVIKDSLGRVRLFGLILLSSLLLSGCVQYQVGVNFDNPNYGEIVQHIKLGERLVSFSGESASAWLSSIERRARELQGTSSRLSNQEINVTIPFNNGAELENKFNTFFRHTDNKTSENVTSAVNDLPQIDSHLSLNQNNLLLLVRNRLSYDLDLRSLELISTNANVQITSGSILEFEFSLNTPWGARSVEKSPNAIQPEKQGNQLIWRLQPGQINHLEAVFWLPSPIGIGTVVIALFVAAGIFLRYIFMPDPTEQFAIRNSPSAPPAPPSPSSP